MAIETVNARYEGFIFDGQNSRNYGVYVTDVEVFGAPVRNVEMIQIPGRNGSYALDNGFYENIQVTYKCAMGCESQADFNAGISAFRNMLASRIGYKRLEDEINTDEYRMACFHGGISVPTLNKDTATFDVVFDCKPQRFLKSGETAVTIGGDVTNTKTETGSIVTIEGTGVDKVTSLVAQITPQQAGSGDPSPTNVRSITGWTAAAVNVVGKNLIGFKSLLDNWGSEYTDLGDSYNVTTTGTGYREPFRFASKDIDVTLSGEITQLSGSAGWRLQLLNSSGEAVATLGSNLTAASGKGCKLRLNYSTGGEGANFKNIQVELGTTATAYESYKGTTYPVSFGSAGTVYGGTLDVATGVLTVTHKMHTFDGTETLTFYNAYGGVRFQDNEMNTTQLPIRDFIANTMKGAEARGAAGTPPCIKTYTATTGVDTHFLFVCMQDATDTESASAWLQAHPTQVVYPITPKTYQLTAQQVELLAGNNTVWTDTGNITITWGDDPNKLVNPTLYDAHPLLSFTASGAGTININNDTISVTNQPIGDIVLANVVKLESGESVTWTDTSRYLTGDAIRIDSIPAIQTTVVMDSYSYANYTSYSGDDMDYLSTTSTSRGMLVTHSIPTPPQYVAGTAKSDTYSATVINKVKHKTTGNIVDCTINLTVAIAYDGANNITVTNTVTTSIGTASTAVTINTVIVNSTKSSLNGTAYIDLDIGEAYSIDGGAVVSINDSVSIGAALPVLGVGTNTVSKTGSVANLKVTPRWWQL